MKCLLGKLTNRSLDIGTGDSYKKPGGAGLLAFAIWLVTVLCNGV